MVMLRMEGGMVRCGVSGRATVLMAETAARLVTYFAAWRQIVPVAPGRRSARPTIAGCVRGGVRVSFFLQ